MMLNKKGDSSLFGDTEERSERKDCPSTLTGATRETGRMLVLQL
jgi:hypothetical protein